MACAGASQLEKVELGWCSSVTDADVKALARLPMLREIDLSRTLVRSLLRLCVSQHLDGPCYIVSWQLPSALAHELGQLVHTSVHSSVT